MTYRCLRCGRTTWFDRGRQRCGTPGCHTRPVSVEVYLERKGRVCAAGKCARRIPPHLVACREHWFSLPKALRDEFNRAVSDARRQRTQAAREELAAVTRRCCKRLEEAA